MEKAFLRQVAQLFVNDNLDDYTFVFPNRRSSLFFLKHLGELKKKPLFAPKVFTISELFSSLSELENLPKLPLMLRLWKVWCQEQEKAWTAANPDKSYIKEELDDFITWGGVILSDFNDVDQYMVSAESLFSNMKDLGNIRPDYSFLNEDQKAALNKLLNLRKDLDNKETQKKYFDVWDLMLPVYQAFRKNLIEEGKSYSAMQHRFVAEEVEALDRGESNQKLKEKLDKLGDVVFIGFSAPTKCEKVLMKHFSDKDGCGFFYWDFYSEMVKDPANRSSLLIKECLENFKCIRPLKDPKGQVTEKACSYTVVPAEGPTAQTMIAADILKKVVSLGGDETDTAIVVSDESLLLPLLQMLDDVSVNITMGYPLQGTSAFSFVSALSSLHLTSDVRNGEVFLSGNALRTFLDHSYIKSINEVQSSKASGNILKNNMIRIGVSKLSLENPLEITDSNLSDLLKLLIPSAQMYPDNTEGSASLMKAIVSYQRRIIEYVSAFLPSRERSFLNVYHDVLDSVYSSDIVFSRPRTIYAALRAGLKASSVPFSGEPLKGIQIMGPLETRSLDFDNIIVLSFNEGVFPANGEQSSSIPYFLRKAFGLPTYEEMDSISAYNFYRLIQRASRVFLLYDCATVDSTKAKEESRFVKQLVYDYGVKPEICYYTFPVPSGSVSYETDLVADTPDLENLKRFFPSLNGTIKAGALSPTALNAYLACPRRFFLSKVLKIEEDTELTDTVEANTFGDLFHYCMQILYKNYLKDKAELIVDEKLMSNIREEVKNQEFLDNLVNIAFGEIMNVSIVDGENILIREAVENYIRMTVEADYLKAVSGSFSILGLEYLIPMMEVCGANFTAIIDRLEKQNGIYRICDYKTGMFVPVNKNIPQSLKDKGFEIRSDISSRTYKAMDDDEFSELLEAIFAGGGDRYCEIMFQMLVYAILLCEHKHYNGDVEISIYQLRIIDKAGPVTVLVTSSQLDAFRQALNGLTNELRAKADGSAPAVFRVSEGIDACTYCDFKKFCRRT